MKISGITTCVGNEYAQALARSLRVWLETLDELVVVTDHAALCTYYCAHFPQLDFRKFQFAVTDAFTRNNAYFNKGAALNVGLEFIKDPEWLLSFDADIIPPADWRTKAEPQLEPGNLYGCHRDYEGKPPIPKRNPLQPIGYFQLWHAHDPHAQQPAFSEKYTFAGGYDFDFMQQWPRSHWKDLNFRVLHQGESRRNWCGVGNTDKCKEMIVQRRKDKRTCPR